MSFVYHIFNELSILELLCEVVGLFYELASFLSKGCCNLTTFYQHNKPDSTASFCVKVKLLYISSV